MTEEYGDWDRVSYFVEAEKNYLKSFDALNSIIQILYWFGCLIKFIWLILIISSADACLI